jgi:predicted DNA-binding transcriptional regulator AlpA
MPTLQLIPREQVLKRMNVSDSTERRKRKSGDNWPAHVMVGNRILYSESSVNEWIAAQESANTGLSGGGDFSPDVEAAIERRAAELAAKAPPLTARQIAQLREIFANPAGGSTR